MVTETTWQLKCPVCGSTDIIYSEETGEYVCARCGTVVLEKEEAELMLAFQRPQLFVSHQIRKTRNEDLMNSQTFTITKNRPGALIRLNSRYAFKTEKTYSGWITIITDNLIGIYRYLSYYGRYYPKILINFSRWPNAISILLVLRQGRFYSVRRHNIEINIPADKKEMAERIKDIAMHAAATTVYMLYKGTSDDIKARKVSQVQRAIANVIGFLLIRLGILPKPYKVVNGRPKFGKYANITVDGEPASGKKILIPWESMKKNNPQLAQLVYYALNFYLQQAINILNTKTPT